MQHPSLLLVRPILLVITLRCTERLRSLLKVPDSLGAATSPALLGDWYANLLTTRPRHLAICVNERSLLVLILPLAPHSSFLTRFRESAVARISQVLAPAEALRLETDALEHVQIGKTQSRSVLGSLNELRYLGKVHLTRQPVPDPESLALFLCHTPMFALTTSWSWMEATMILGGDVDEARRRLIAAT